jgi:hypothetical protein
MVSHGEGSSNLERQANELPECAYKAGTNICIQLFFFGFHTLMKRAVKPEYSGDLIYQTFLKDTTSTTTNSKDYKQ